MSNSSEYNRIHGAYNQSVSSANINPIQKDPRIEQKRVRKTSTLDLIKSVEPTPRTSSGRIPNQTREFYAPPKPSSRPIVQHTPIPQQPAINNVSSTSLSEIPHPPQPSIVNIPVPTPVNIGNVETSLVHASSSQAPPNTQVSGGLSPQQIQLTQEIVRQAIHEIGKQSPILLQALLKDITVKAQKYISPILKDPEEEQKRVFKTSVSEVINPVEVLHNKISNFAEELRETIKMLGTRLSDSIKIPTTYKYIDIDSTYRNRNLYPYPCNFVVPFTDGAPKDSGLTADDPVFLGYPWVMGTVNTISASSSTTSIISNFPVSPLPANYDGNLGLNPLILIPNFYEGYYMQVFTNSGLTPGLTSQFSKILSNTAKEEFTVSPPISNPGIAQNRIFRIRKDVPILSNYLPAGSTENTVILSSDASPDYGFYDGCLLILYSPTNYTTITGYKIISSYDGLTKTATLVSAFGTAPAAGVPFEIVKFSYDNLTPLRNSGTRALNQPVCLDIILLHLVVPFSPYRNPSTGVQKLNITTGNGGSLRNYPYLYVHFYNDNTHSQTTMYGNNPSADIATFKVTLDNPLFPIIQGADFALQGQFLVFNNINVSAPQNIKLSTLESMRFRVTLPNGEDLRYDLPDNYSPLPPNPRVQFSAMIAVNRKF